MLNALKKVIGIKTKNICSNFFPKSVGLFSQLFEQNFPGILCMTNGDMSGHVQWTCGSEMHTAALTIILFLVDTQGTCSKNAEQPHTTGMAFAFMAFAQTRKCCTQKKMHLIDKLQRHIPFCALILFNLLHKCKCCHFVSTIHPCYSPLGDLVAATCHSDKSLHRLLQL